MEATANQSQSFIHEQDIHVRPRSRSPSFVATLTAYFLIFYLYSSLAWIVMFLYPGVKVAYFLYALVGTWPFLFAINRSGVEILRDHWPFILLITVYFLYISVQYALFDMADIPAVRESYFEKGQFFVAVLAALIAFELSFDFRNILRALYLVVIVSCAINVIEFFDPAALPIQLSTVPGRAAGLYQNPNVSAMFIASVIPLLCAASSKKARIWCYAVTGIGTFITFSRGGWALWLVAVVITELGLSDRRRFNLNPKNIIIIAGVTIVAIGLAVIFEPALSLLISGLGSNLDANTATRLELLTNDTTISRLELARQGLMAFTKAPIFGHGVGYTWQWEFGLSVHDMFVLMLAEQGILGFIWLMSLLVIWWRYSRPYGWWMTVLFCVAALTTHNYFDGPIPAIVIALYLVAAFKLPAQMAAKLRYGYGASPSAIGGYAQNEFPLSKTRQSRSLTDR